MNHGLHPIIASAPVLFLLVGICGRLVGEIMQIESIRSAGRYALLLALIFTATAFFSGYYAADSANQRFIIADSLITEHQFWGRLSLFLMVPAVALGFIADRATHSLQLFWWCSWILLCSALGLLLVTSGLGGDLVFTYGAGVKAQ